MSSNRSESNFSIKNTYNISKCAYSILEDKASNLGISVPEFLNMLVVDDFASYEYDKELYTKWYNDLKNYFLMLSDYEMFSVFIKCVEAFKAYTYLPVKEDTNGSFKEIDNLIVSVFANAGYGKIESRHMKFTMRFYKYQPIKDIFDNLGKDKNVKRKLNSSKSELNRLMKISAGL